MKFSRQPIENTSWCSPFSMAFKTLMGSATSITFRTEKDSIRDTSRPTIIPPSSCPHSATKWHSSGTTDTQLTSKKNRRIDLFQSINPSVYLSINLTSTCENLWYHRCKIVSTKQLKESFVKQSRI